MRKAYFSYFQLKWSNSKATVRFPKLSEAVHQSLQIRAGGGARVCEGSRQLSVQAAPKTLISPLFPPCVGEESRGGTSSCLPHSGALLSQDSNHGEVERERKIKISLQRS